MININLSFQPPTSIVTIKNYKLFFIILNTYTKLNVRRTLEAEGEGARQVVLLWYGQRELNAQRPAGAVNNVHSKWRV